MLVELTKDDLVRLIIYVYPSKNMMGEYSKLKYGEWVGGYVNDWRWDRFNLEKLTEQELYNIYKEC